MTHLSFTPPGGVLDRVDRDFIRGYCARLYPRRLQAFGEEMREWYRTLFVKGSNGAYSYFLSHVTDTTTGEYSFTEKIEDSCNSAGFRLEIAPTSADDREQLVSIHTGDGVTNGVGVVIAYLEDILNTEQWEGVSCYNSTDARNMVGQLITLLGRVKHIVRVVSISNDSLEEKFNLKLTLAVSGVVNYNVKLSWGFL